MSIEITRSFPPVKQKEIKKDLGLAKRWGHLGGIFMVYTPHKPAFFYLVTSLEDSAHACARPESLQRWHVEAASPKC